MTLSKREMKSLEIIMNDKVAQINPSKFIVQSQSNPNTTYEVRWNRKRWICNCEDFKRRKKACKHIHAVRYYMVLQSITSEVKTPTDQPFCPKCNSSDIVIKRGIRYNKSCPVQRYFCKRCGIKFTNRTAFKGMKN
ncbi:MAG: hypothetical protein ACPLYF_05020, partial [Fervidobacterium sp.]